MRSLSATPAPSRACQCSRQSRIVCHSSVPDVRVEGSRRTILATLATAVAVSAAPASAEVPELTTLYGLATPPTSYGGYGGNVKEAPKYKFLYPASWKELTVNKVQKVSTCLFLTVSAALCLSRKAPIIINAVHVVGIHLQLGAVVFLTSLALAQLPNEVSLVFAFSRGLAHRCIH